MMILVQSLASGVSYSAHYAPISDALYTHLEFSFQSQRYHADVYDASLPCPQPVMALLMGTHFLILAGFGNYFIFTHYLVVDRPFAYSI